MAAADGLDEQVWAAFFDEQGRILDEYNVRKLVYAKGILPQLRPQIWKFLLNVYPFTSTTVERQQIDHENRVKYHLLVAAWKEKEQKKDDKQFEKDKKVIDKDVRRTDRDHPYFGGEEETNPALLMERHILLAHMVHDPDLGYVQGMSDLVTPLLFTFKNEVDTFWCFASYMRRMRGNFINIAMCEGLTLLKELAHYVDPLLTTHLETCVAEGQEQWLFCYRWVLLDLKREFFLENIIPLWETSWAEYLTSYFVIFACLALLRLYRAPLLSISKPEDILNFLQGLSMQINVFLVIEQAKQLVARIKGDSSLPSQLRVLVTPLSGQTFVPPPQIGFKRDSREKARASVSNAPLNMTSIHSPLASTLAAPPTGGFFKPPPLRSSYRNAANSTLDAINSSQYLLQGDDSFVSPEMDSSFYNASPHPPIASRGVHDYVSHVPSHRDADSQHHTKSRDYSDVIGAPLVLLPPPNPFLADILKVMANGMKKI